MTETNPTAENARRILPLIDLTNLNDDCTDADIDALCAAAQTEFGPVAAVCVWPRFVARAVAALEGTPVGVATVVNFPSGDGDSRAVLAETKQVVADGADEVDLVMPYKALMDGDDAPVRDIVSMVRAATDGRSKLKVIIETGVLMDDALIAWASRAALEEGADFIKTSTGKVAVNATPEAARVMLDELASFGEPGRGFKPAGGMKTVADAASYLQIADAVMGPEWATAATMRFGASSLLGSVLDALGGTADAPGNGSY